MRVDDLILFALVVRLKSFRAAAEQRAERLRTAVFT